MAAYKTRTDQTNSGRDSNSRARNRRAATRPRSRRSSGLHELPLPRIEPGMFRGRSRTPSRARTWKNPEKLGRVERQELNQGMLGASIKILLLERVSAHKMG